MTPAGPIDPEAVLPRLASDIPYLTLDDLDVRNQARVASGYMVRRAPRLIPG